MRFFLLLTGGRFKRREAIPPTKGQKRSTRADSRSRDKKKDPPLAGLGVGCDELHSPQAPPVGDERPPEIPGETLHSANDCAVACAIDADLGSIIEAWPKLNESTKAGILATVRASRDG